MGKTSKILYQSVKATSRHLWWWLFAFLQAAAFTAVGHWAKPTLLGDSKIFLLILSGILLSPLTVLLWQMMAKDQVKDFKYPKPVIFLEQISWGALVILVTVIVIILAHYFFPFWPFHTFIFAIVASTAGLVLLYLALLEQSLTKAFRLAMDTWDKKISFIGTSALILILSHAISYTLVHGVWANLGLPGGFSVSGYSATIWILLSVLTVLMAYLAAVLNCFVVLIFFENIARKKDPQPEKIEATEPVAAPAITRI